MNRVVISGGHEEFQRWARQFSDFSTDRSVVELPNNPSISAVVSSIRGGVANLDPSGYVIFSVGHGGAANVSNGMLDLAPNRLIRITPDVFQNPDNLMRRPFFTIGRILKRARVGRVVLLTCRVGNAIDFVQQISNLWEIPVMGYKKRVVGVIDQQGQARVYLQGDAPGTGTNISLAEHEIPAMDNTDEYYVARSGRRSRTVPRMMRPAN